MNTPRVIRSTKACSATITVPPSKSYTNRALIAAALAEGASTILHPSASDDTELLIGALGGFGVTIVRSPDALEVTGTAGVLRAPPGEINVGNAGTAMRFLASFAALAPGTTRLDGDEQMRQRPIGDLLSALKMAGVKCTSDGGFPPVEIHGGTFNGGAIEMEASLSSQFLSSLLLASPYAKRMTSISLKGKASSLPYVDMTLHVMRSFGALFEDVGQKLFRVDTRQRYLGREFAIEPDASAATYFLAAAAITGGEVEIPNLQVDSFQGDCAFTKILAEMGCKAVIGEEGVVLTGGPLIGIDIDMNRMPDCVPALAIVAAFAKGSTIIRNIAHLQFKETNRILAVAAGLRALGCGVETAEESLIIHPLPLTGGTVATMNDHRIAMAFAVAGLRVKGVVIDNPGCVSKSFPRFWNEFSKVEGAEHDGG